LQLHFAEADLQHRRNDLGRRKRGEAAGNDADLNTGDARVRFSPRALRQRRGGQCGQRRPPERHTPEVASCPCAGNVQRTTHAFAPMFFSRGISRSALPRSMACNSAGVKTRLVTRPRPVSSAVRYQKSVPNTICETPTTFFSASMAMGFDDWAVS